MNDHDILSRLKLGRAKIRNRKAWVQGDWCIGSAEDRMCALGALGMRSTGDYYNPHYMPLVDELAKHLPADHPTTHEIRKVYGCPTPLDLNQPHRVYRFNDGDLTKHEDVLGVFDRAIAAVAGRIEEAT